MNSARIVLWESVSSMSALLVAAQDRRPAALRGRMPLSLLPGGKVVPHAESTKTTILSLCTLAVLSCALVSCGGANAQIASAHSQVLVGDQNTSVLHGKYIWKSQGFSVSNHSPFVEAGQMYFDGAGHHWGSSTMNVDGSAHYHICATWCGGTYNINDRLEGTFTAAPQYGDTCNLETTVDGSTAYCVSTDPTSTWIMEFTRRGD
jgi:hypothetical protein